MATGSGPILFGYCLDIALYGILTIQTYLYYLAFPQDRRMTKSIVCFVYIVGTLQMAFALHDFYTLFCTPQGHRKLESPFFDIHTFGFMSFTIPAGGALAAFAVQLFYAHRIYLISKARVATIIVSILAFLQFIFGILSAVYIFRPPRNLFLNQLAGIISLFVGPLISAACDLVIAIYMSRYLSRQTKGIPKATQVLVTKIGQLLLGTGILTAGVAVVYATLIFSLPSGLPWFLLPGLSLGKLYANSMLVLLNNRFTIPGGRNVLHTDLDIPSYRHSDLAGAICPVSSHSIAFAYNRQEEATRPSGEVHTTGLNPPNWRVSQESRG